MCCRPKASFLIEDILQHSPTKTSDSGDSPWPTRPTPVYLNQVSSLHHTSDMARMPTPTSAARGVYVSDGLITEDRLRIHEYSHQRHSQPLTDPLMEEPRCIGGFGRCWAVMPNYSLTVLTRHHGHKRKGGQVRFSTQQTSTLEGRFSEHKYLSPEERHNLAAQLKLSDRQVKTWFQNRRAKWRRTNTSKSRMDGSQSHDSTSSNTLTDEDAFDNSLLPVNILG
ncbi:hematopoietically-expressed homeobox protein hhex [Cryptotermes secundus]|uniref:hematopoietically-expressed homeobox protein hhex n=1 Tax=Cryptotermes secundus TaxID=105785 RepID=UPI000CD7BEB1|nr:hematopoietically-expressed homeobox protein hhex [Cryptotermes secundus]